MRDTKYSVRMRAFLLTAAAGLLMAGPLLAQEPEKKPEEKAKPAVKPEDRWESAIAAFEARDKKKPPPKDGILFVGSSSIVGWDVAKSFPGLPVINRGVGGSQIADSVRYAERIVLPHRPKIVVFYAGDNDLAAGKSPQQVAADYRAFVKKVHDALPKTRIVYVGIKPSIARWKLVDKVREANSLIRGAVEKDPRLVFVDVEKPMLGADGKPRGELFKPDGLHMNADGYKVWNELVGPHLK
jgi:lysophospholipase L1-like esterase